MRNYLMKLSEKGVRVIFYSSQLFPSNLDRLINISNDVVKIIHHDPLSFAFLSQSLLFLLSTF